MLELKDILFLSMKDTGYSNVLEYANGISDNHTIPRTLGYEIFDKSILSPEAMSSFYQHGVFADAWGQPIVIMLTTNRNGKVGVTMHSFGKNKRNENGGGDDIVLWISADMSEKDFIRNEP